MLFAIDFDCHGMDFITNDTSHLLSSQYLTTISLNGCRQRLCNKVTSSLKTEGTLVIEIHNKSMCGKRSFVFLCRIKRKVAH